MNRAGAQGKRIFIFFLKKVLTDLLFMCNVVSRLHDMTNSASKKTRQYRKLKASLIHRGYTLRSFAAAHGYSAPTVYMAARGQRHGIISVRIQRHLREFIKTEVVR
jgi:hypothetical protein